MGVMFHSAPPEVSAAHLNDTPETDLATPDSYDVNRYLAAEIEFRHLSPGIPGPMTSDSSRFSDISTSLPDPASQRRHTLGWTQHDCAHLDPLPLNFDSDPSAFGHPPQSALSLIDSRQQQSTFRPSSAAAEPSEPSQSQLPSKERVLEMVNSFFSA
ncbi:hypothetical protein ARSEF1564_008352 [Beauveria bassiana]